MSNKYLKVGSCPNTATPEEIQSIIEARKVRAEEIKKQVIKEIFPLKDKVTEKDLRKLCSLLMEREGLINSLDILTTIKEMKEVKNRLPIEALEFLER